MSHRCSVSGIIRNIIIPEFKNGNFESGIINGTKAILNVVLSEADYSRQNTSNTSSSLWYFMQNFGFIILVVVGSILGKSQSLGG